MLTIHETPNFPETYPLSRLGIREELLFFDIETTGFSGERTNLYLIGCVYYENGRWNLVQWFADAPEAEKETLVAFFQFLKRFTTVIHFNGDGFDIPYLLKRCRAYGLSYDFSGIKSVDIYKKIRPYRSLLNLSSMKQKAVEQFLGIGRTDEFTGGQLIEVYKDYLITHEESLLQLLLLHNADDLRGMPGILPILSYPDCLEHDLYFESQSLLSRKDVFGRECPFLKLVYRSDYSLPVPFKRTSSVADIDGEDGHLTASLQLYEGELKYFYPDYKNYYYLIYEDSAIHKSVAEYVDKDVRKKATAKTCYTRRQGRYLPQFSPDYEPVLSIDYKDRITYFPYEEKRFEDPGFTGSYIRHLLNYLSKA